MKTNFLFFVKRKAPTFGVRSCVREQHQVLGPRQKIKEPTSYMNCCLFFYSRCGRNIPPLRCP